jgi:excisionase family DNA binding protein
MSYVETELDAEPQEPVIWGDGRTSCIGKLYLTISEAAVIARCSPCTIRRAIARRALAVVKPNGRHGRTLI